MSETLGSLADGANLILAGNNYPEIAANIAEYQRIPFASLHAFPIRPNGKVALPPLVPSALSRPPLSMRQWLRWRTTKAAEDVQRRELGLPKATTGWVQRIIERGSVESRHTTSSVSPGWRPNGPAGGGPSPAR